MALTPAEKQRRYRLHSNGDHSTCDPKRRCAVVEAAEVAENEGLGEQPGPVRSVKAQKLWDELSALALGPIEEVLADEACACVDRLVLLRSRQTEVAMTEARHQATALKGLLAEIRKGVGGGSAKTPKAPTRAPTASTDDPGEGGARDTSFSARLAQKRAASAG